MRKRSNITTINEAIKWYKDKETEYKYLSKEYEDFAMMAEQYHQFVEWLTELKDLREENKVLTSECDRLIKEKGELLSKVSGGDVLRICQLEEQLEKAKQLLKATVEDFAKLDRENAKNKNCMMPEMDCADCPLSWDSVDERVEPCHNWRYANEALKLIES